MHVLFGVYREFFHGDKDIAEEAVDFQIDPIWCLAGYSGHHCLPLEGTENDHSEFHY